jgi:hypothetical protein
VRERGTLQAADVALEFGAGEAAAAADVNRAQFADLHQRVDRRAADAQHDSGFFRGQEEWIAGQYVAERLRITHVDSSPDRTFAQDAGGRACLRLPVCCLPDEDGGPVCR